MHGEFAGGANRQFDTCGHVADSSQAWSVGVHFRMKEKEKEIAYATKSVVNCFYIYIIRD